MRTLKVVKIVQLRFSSFFTMTPRMFHDIVWSLKQFSAVLAAHFFLILLSFEMKEPQMSVKVPLAITTLVFLFAQIAYYYFIRLWRTRRWWRWWRWCQTWNPTYRTREALMPLHPAGLL